MLFFSPHLQKLSEEEMATIDKVCKEEANAFILFDPEIVKGLFRRGLIYFDVSVYPEDRFKGSFSAFKFFVPIGFFFLLLKFKLVLRSKYFLLFLSMGISLPCLGVRELLSVEELPAIKSGLKGDKLGRVLGEWRIICWNNTFESYFAMEGPYATAILYASTHNQAKLTFSSPKYPNSNPQCSHSLCRAKCKPFAFPFLHHQLPQLFASLSEFIALNPSPSPYKPRSPSTNRNCSH